MGRKKIARFVFDDTADALTQASRTLQLLECDEAIRALPIALKDAHDRKISYVDFINMLLDPVMQKREDQRIERWIKQAKFPFLRTIEQYNFDFPDFIEKEKVLRLTTCDWIENGGNALFFGPSGVGKTHLSVALGLNAITQGFETRFVTINDLKDLISTAMRKDKLQDSDENRKKLLASLSKVRLLIIDEIDYSTISKEMSDFLYHLLFERYEEHTSTIITSNSGLADWKKFFPDNESRAMAVIDRILHNCIALKIEGKSYRTAGIQIPGTPRKTKISSSTISPHTW